jgi:hypothetical protein
MALQHHPTVGAASGVDLWRPCPEAERHFSRSTKVSFPNALAAQEKSLSYNSLNIAATDRSRGRPIRLAYLPRRRVPPS